MHAQVSRGITAILDAFPCIDLPRRFSVVRSTWAADPLTRGSYSYVTPGTSGSHIDALAAPLVSWYCTPLIPKPWLCSPLLLSGRLLHTLAPSYAP